MDEQIDPLTNLPSCEATYTKTDDKELYVIQIEIPALSTFRNKPHGTCRSVIKSVRLSEGSLGGELSWIVPIVNIGRGYLVDFAACLDEAFVQTTRKTNFTINLYANGVETFSETVKQRATLKKNPEEAVQMNQISATRRCGGTIPLKFWTDEVNEIRFQIQVEQIRGTKSGIALINTGKYFMSEDLADVSIKVGTEAFPCHRFVLHEKSPVFLKMFEHEQKETQNRCVELNEVDPGLVREFLRFLYVGEVEVIDRFCCELYEFAHLYMVEELKSLCEEAMVKYSTKENILPLLGLAKKYKLPRLAERAKEIFSENKKEVFNNSLEFLDLVKEVPDVVYDLVME